MLGSLGVRGLGFFLFAGGSRRRRALGTEAGVVLAGLEAARVDVEPLLELLAKLDGACGEGGIGGGELWAGEGGVREACGAAAYRSCRSGA